MTTTFDGLRDIIARDFELPAERLRRDTALEEIELDSLAITELVFALEDEFHVTAGNVNPAFKNLGDIADYIETLIAERDAAPKGARGAAKPARTAAANPARSAKPPRAPAPKSARSRAPKSARANGGKPAATGPGDAPPRKRKRSSATASGVRPR